jgi:hypothetical protein
MKITKSELKEMIREALREELSEKPLKEARNTPTVTIDELKNISMPASTYALMQDPYYDESFYCHNGYEWGTNYFIDEVENTCIYDNFSDAVVDAIECADEHDTVFIVQINPDDDTAEPKAIAEIGTYTGGQHNIRIYTADPNLSKERAIV